MVCPGGRAYQEKTWRENLGRGGSSRTRWRRRGNKGKRSRWDHGQLPRRAVVCDLAIPPTLPSPGDGGRCDSSAVKKRDRGGSVVRAGRTVAAAAARYLWWQSCLQGTTTTTTTTSARMCVQYYYQPRCLLNGSHQATHTLSLSLSLDKKAAKGSRPVKFPRRMGFTGL